MRPSILSLLLWFGPPVEPEIVEIVPVIPVILAPDPEPALPPREPSEPPALAPEPAPEREPAAGTTPPDLHVHWEVDAPLVIGAGAISLALQLSLDRSLPPTPRWTGATAPDLALRNALTWRSTASARHLSDAVAVGVVPLLGLTLTLVDIGASRQWRYVHEDLIIMSETLAVAMMLSQVLKISIARGRPYTYEVYQDDSDQSVDRLLVHEPDAFLSFPSGHTNLTFAFVASCATVATLRKRRLAPYLWGFGMPLAGVVGYLRVAGHRHWFSDVMIGSTIGTLVGTGLPLLLHHPEFGLLSRLSARKRRAQINVVPSASGAMVVGRF